MKNRDYEGINSKIREKTRRDWHVSKSLSISRRRKWSYVLNIAKRSHSMMVKKFQLYLTWEPPESQQQQLQQGSCVRCHTTGKYKRDLR